MAVAPVFEQIRARGRLRGTVALLGPAFVAAVAYIDPGNFATNISGGAQFGYLLVWVIVLANLFAMLVQYLSAKAGVATGRDLPELCREFLPRPVSRGLWVQAEIVAMATDLAEFVGAAIGLHLLFGVPLFAAGIITAVVAFAILGLQQRGYRRFELAIAALLGIILLGFLYDLMHVKVDPGQVAGGLVPGFAGVDSVMLAVGIIGATVMPHVVYLHSALTSNRIPTQDIGEKRELLRFQRLDVLIGLGAAGLINLSMLVVAASLFHDAGVPFAEGDAIARVLSALWARHRDSSAPPTAALGCERLQPVAGDPRLTPVARGRAQRKDASRERPPQRPGDAERAGADERPA